MNKKLARQLATVEELARFILEYELCPECGLDTGYTMTRQTLEVFCTCGWFKEFSMDDTNEAAVRY